MGKGYAGAVTGDGDEDKNQAKEEVCAGEDAPLITDDDGELRVPVREDSALQCVYGYRWAVLFAVFFLNMVNAGLWLTYSPITDLVHDKYDVPTTVVNILSQVMGGMYGPIVWSAAPVIKRTGFANGCRAAALVTCLGAVIRCFAKDHSTFALLVLGQVVSGSGRPVISQLLTLVSQNWFPPRQRALATTLAALGNPIGIGMGFVLPTTVTRDDPDNITELHIITAGIAGAMLLYVLLFIREKPPTPPSMAADLDPELKLKYTDELRALCRSKMYWLNAVSFGIAFGQSFALAILLNQFLKPFGYSHGAVGAGGVMVILPGIIGSGIVAGYVGKRPVYREVLMVLFLVCALATQFVTWLALRTGLGNYNAFLLLGAGTLGFFVQPTFAVALELGAETVFPVSPATAGAGVIMCAQYVGLVMSLGLGAYMDVGEEQSQERRDRVHVAGCIMSGCFLIGACMMIFFNAPQLRREYEARKAAEEGECGEEGQSQVVTDVQQGGTAVSFRSSRAPTWVSGSVHGSMPIAGTPTW